MDRRYCASHFKSMVNGAERTLKNGQTRSIKRNSGHKRGASTPLASSDANQGRKFDNRKKARLVTVTTPDGERVEADLDPLQMDLFKAVLVGAKFDPPEEGERNEQVDEVDEDVSVLQDLISFTPQ